MAADSLGMPPISQTDLLDEIAWPEPRVSFGLVEMAGGVASPISHDGDPIDFVRAVRPDNVLLVADAGLGTINAIRLSLEALCANLGDAAQADQFIVVLNRFDDRSELHLRNAAWLAAHGVAAVLSPSDDAQSCAKRLIERIFPAS
jgi:dethiobiotin synthetase